MTAEEQVRRMLTEAVAAEPETAGAPFEQVVRRRRRRSLRAAVVATALLLTAAVAVAGVRGPGAKPTLPAAPSVPPGWKLFQSPAYNLQFRYPPDWVVSGRGGLTIGPRKLSPTGSRPSTIAAPGPMFISLGLSTDYYQFVIQNGTQVTPGRLAGGRAFVRWTGTVSGTHIIAYEVDWGRFCLGRQSCGSHSVSTQIQATDPAMLDRYSPIAQRIIGTLAPIRPAQASTGDPARPACRADQWRPVFASRSRVAVDRPRWVIGASIQYLHGPPCHLQTSLRLTVERSDGTAVAVAGTPSPLTVEADLPEDGGTAGDIMRTATMRYWGWDNWCARPLPQARLRITANGGMSTTRPIPPRSIQDPRFPCQPSAPWRSFPCPDLGALTGPGFGHQGGASSCLARAGLTEGLQVSDGGAGEDAGDQRVEAAWNHWWTRANGHPLPQATRASGGGRRPVRLQHVELDGAVGVGPDPEQGAGRALGDQRRRGLVRLGRQRQPAVGRRVVDGVAQLNHP